MDTIASNDSLPLGGVFSVRWGSIGPLVFCHVLRGSEVLRTFRGVGFQRTVRRASRWGLTQVR